MAPQPGPPQPGPPGSERRCPGTEPEGEESGPDRAGVESRPTACVVQEADATAPHRWFSANAHRPVCAQVTGWGWGWGKQLTTKTRGKLRQRYFRSDRLSKQEKQALGPNLAATPRPRLLSEPLQVTDFPKLVVMCNTQVFVQPLETDSMRRASATSMTGQGHLAPWQREHATTTGAHLLRPWAGGPTQPTLLPPWRPWSEPAAGDTWEHRSARFTVWEAGPSRPVAGEMQTQVSRSPRETPRRTGK